MPNLSKSEKSGFLGGIFSTLSVPGNSNILRGGHKINSEKLLGATHKNALNPNNLGHTGGYRSFEQINSPEEALEMATNEQARKVELEATTHQHKVSNATRILSSRSKQTVGDAQLHGAYRQYQAAEIGSEYVKVRNNANLHNRAQQARVAYGQIGHTANNVVQTVQHKLDLLEARFLGKNRAE